MHERELEDFENWYKRYQTRLDAIVDGICNSVEKYVTMPKSNVYNFYFDTQGMRNDLLKHMYRTSNIYALE